MSTMKLTGSWAHSAGSPTIARPRFRQWYRTCRGTLVPAFLAARFAPTKPGLLALVCGLFFLLGGVYNVAVLPGPLWFEALDLIVAYLPMAWLGYMMGSQREATANK
jgi:hypothetical protein